MMKNFWTTTFRSMMIIARSARTPFRLSQIQNNMSNFQFNDSINYLLQNKHESCSTFIFEKTNNVAIKIRCTIIITNFEFETYNCRCTLKSID